MPIIAGGGLSSPAFPGIIPTKLVPRLSTWLNIKLCAPAPTAIIIITAPTPIIIPSIVKKLLPLFARSAFAAVLMA